MVISNNAVYGQAGASAMGLWLANVNDEDIYQQKVIPDVGRNSFLPRDGSYPLLIKEEDDDEVPALDADDHQGQVPLQNHWYSQVPAPSDPSVMQSAPGEDLDMLGPTRSAAYQSFQGSGMNRWDVPRLPQNSGMFIPENASLRALAPPTAADIASPSQSASTEALDDPISKNSPSSVPSAVKAKRAKNAASARRSRARQTIRVQTLETKLESLSTDNMCLRYEVEKLRSLVERLQTKLLNHGVSLGDDDRVEPGSATEAADTDLLQ